MSLPAVAHDDAVAIVQEQLAMWLGQEILPHEAWEALTGYRRRYVSWAEVSGYMTGWWIRQQYRAGKRIAA